MLDRYTLNRQPGKALPYFLRLRRPNVFDLIKENNLFTDVQDQALLLVEFDRELREKRKEAGEEIDTEPISAITLLVDHIHSIPASAGSCCDPLGHSDKPRHIDWTCCPATAVKAVLLISIPRCIVP